MSKSQLELFGINIVKLKAGKDKCPLCGRLCRAYCKSLDKRLIKLAWDILIWMRENKRHAFNPKEVWLEDHQKINDFQKLHYFGIIERTHDSGWWKLTKKGYRFLMGEIQLPKRVWVFNNEILRDEQGNPVVEDEMVNVDNADERWQRERSDWVFDYLNYNYKLEI